MGSPTVSSSLTMSDPLKGKIQGHSDHKETEYNVLRLKYYTTCNRKSYTSMGNLTAPLTWSLKGQSQVHFTILCSRRSVHSW